jgi:hypothetical protein
LCKSIKLYMQWCEVSEMRVQWESMNYFEMREYVKKNVLSLWNMWHVTMNPLISVQLRTKAISSFLSPYTSSYYLHNFHPHSNILNDIKFQINALIRNSEHRTENGEHGTWNMEKLHSHHNTIAMLIPIPRPYTKARY